MSTLSFKCPRLTDREVVERFGNVANEMEFKSAEIGFIPFVGGSWQFSSVSDLPQNEIFKELLAAGGASATRIDLVLAAVPGLGKYHVLQLNRTPADLFDSMNTEWGGNVQGRPTEAVFAKMLAVARKHFGEMKIDEALTGFPNETINRYMEARDATLNRLEQVSNDLLFRIQERQKELDTRFAARVTGMEKDFEARRQELQGQFDQRTGQLQADEAALKKRLEEFETNESKYLRRQLRQDMLKMLESFKSKFELTESTRGLRRPIFWFTLALLAVFGVLMVSGFYQSFELLRGQDLSKINWFPVMVLTLKQLGFTAAFIATAYFYIKWNDRWFRQHADAEFMFKRLEMDINRASWVVEMAMEWKADEGTEIPAQLLDRLTQNLFKDGGSGGDGDSPPNVADVILGSAATVKFKTPGGTEVDIDRKGLQKALAAKAG